MDTNDILSDRLSQAEWISSSIRQLMTSPEDLSWKNRDIANILFSWLIDVQELFDIQSKCLSLWDKNALNDVKSMRNHLHQLVDDSNYELDYANRDGIADNDFSQQDEPVFESPSYIVMKNALKDGLDIYVNSHPDTKLFEFKTAISDYLDSFLGGNAKNSFSFSISIREQKCLEYIDFNFEEDIIEISCGGSVYDPLIGGDSYTNWNYSVWSNGDEDNELSLVNLPSIYHMFSQVENAKLSIDFPDSFFLDPDNDSEV